MRKGKSYKQVARKNMLKQHEALARKRARKQAAYDQRQYDKPCGEDQ